MRNTHTFSPAACSTSSPCVTASGHGLNEMLHTIRLQLLTEDDLKEAAHRIGVTPAPITLLNEFRSYREALVFLESLRQKFLESVEVRAAPALLPHA